MTPTKEIKLKHGTATIKAYADRQTSREYSIALWGDVDVNTIADDEKLPMRYSHIEKSNDALVRCMTVSVTLANGSIITDCDELPGDVFVELREACKLAFNGGYTPEEKKSSSSVAEKQ